MTQIAEVPKEHMLAVWPHIEPLVDLMEAKTDGEQTAASIARDIENGHKLWLAYDKEKDRAIAITTTFITADGSGRKIGVMLTGSGETGKASEWVRPMKETIYNHFREEGCHKVTMIGPRAWGKFFPEMKMRRALFEEVL